MAQVGRNSSQLNNECSSLTIEDYSSLNEVIILDDDDPIKEEPVDVPEEAPPPTKKKNPPTPESPPTCTVCQKTFAQEYNLARHMKAIHYEKVPEYLATRISKIKKYLCCECGQFFYSAKSFELHNKIHGQYRGNINACKHCPLCDFSNMYKRKFIQHFKERHDITITTTNLEFHSKEEYAAWKEKIEDEQRAKFVIEASENYQNRSTRNYVCHRSGHRNSNKVKRKRLNSLAKNIEAGCLYYYYCPAGVRLREVKNTKWEVAFTETHTCFL